MNKYLKKVWPDFEIKTADNTNQQVSGKYNMYNGYLVTKSVARKKNTTNHQRLY
jgi:hypothetical protein